MNCSKSGSILGALVVSGVLIAGGTAGLDAQTAGGNATGGGDIVAGVAGGLPDGGQPSPATRRALEGRKGFQTEIMEGLAQARDKYVGLAREMPESAYGWRPGEGVRSVSEVFMHVAAANIGIIAGTLEMPPPEDADPRWYDMRNAESITDKETIVQALGVAFDYAARVIMDLSDARLEEPLSFFGTQSTVRGMVIMFVNHYHEHLGQAVAYARMNGVVPPWSGGGQ